MRSRQIAKSISRILCLIVLQMSLSACAHSFEPPTGWAKTCTYSGKTQFAQAASNELGPDAKELLLRVDAEQRCMFVTANASQVERAKLWPQIEPIQNELLIDNADWLKRTLPEKNLLDASVYGTTVSNAAWLVIQHADHDPSWQQTMLPRVKKLYELGKLKPSLYALLNDRVAVNAGKLQTFGSQGSCKANGTWEPMPLNDAASVDERRAAVGLEPMSYYITRFRCD